MSVSEHIPGRIKQARRMAGLETQAALLKRIPEWKPSRLGNYEAGVSTPGPDDILKIAQATETSPCWLMFGLGPIRPSSRDLQAIRHQNLIRLVEQMEESQTLLAKTLKISRKQLQNYLENPFQLIEDDMARACESFTQRKMGWMDEQHIADDPMCMAFPEDMRELMMIYSDENTNNRRVILETVKAMAAALGWQALVDDTPSLNNPR